VEDSETAMVSRRSLSRAAMPATSSVTGSMMHSLLG
jgi:hypothetical protein